MNQHENQATATWRLVLCLHIFDNIYWLCLTLVVGKLVGSDNRRRATVARKIIASSIIDRDLYVNNSDPGWSSASYIAI